jgi:two-component system, chemotaxis family, sensor kinase CheA
MSFGEDDEILQDFLVEAGEILDQLSEQLVELEQRPADRDLLNAIFRGFHTVKGGAGFLQLNNMVTCCHVTENLFDILRNGKRPVTSELMDVVLQALDTVNAQFAEVQQRQDPSPAPALLVQRLERLVSCEDLVAEGAPAASPESLEALSLAALSPPKTAPTDGSKTQPIQLTDTQYQEYIDAIATIPSAPSAAAGVAKAATAQAGQPASDEITDDEFERLLDQLHGKGHGPAAATPARDSGPVAGVAAANASASLPKGAGNTEISEDEFEALLDSLHGSGKGPSAKLPEASKSPERTAAASAPKPAPSGGGELITDGEFEALLDQLHGVGKGPSVPGGSVAMAASSPGPATVSPAPKPTEAPVAVTASSIVAAKVAPLAQARPSRPAAQEATAKAEAESASGGETSAGRQAGEAGSNAAEATVRVDTQRLDDIMNMVGELVLVRNRLVRLGLDSNDESLAKAVSNLDVVTADLQTAVMKTRMQPIKKVFGRFPRVVRDLARNLKKEINLELVGEETDLDKNLVEALADPLVHLVRNSVDHGIELPSVREAKGKPRIGKVVLAAEQEGDHILLSISDDGAGMDPVRLREKAVEKGLLEPEAAARLSDLEAFNLIFYPGFSTKNEISDVSGRGVGMDVVKTKITQLNGSIDIQSKVGEGTRFAIKVPLTLAIMPTLMIMLGRQTFAFPLVSVNEIFHMDLRKTHVVDGQECVTIREKAIPLFHLKRWLVRAPYSLEKPTEGHVVIVNVGTRRVGFVVDQLIGQEEVVIKPLGKMLQGTPGMAGATITGDGTIALILDVPSMLNKYVGAV